MNNIMLMIFTLFTLASCTDGGRSHGNRKAMDPSSVTSDPSSPGEPIDAEEADLLHLEAREIEAVRFGLSKRISVSKWKEHSRMERSVLAGAALQMVLATVRPIDWASVTDRDIEYLLKLYFDSELNLSMKGSTL